MNEWMEVWMVCCKFVSFRLWYPISSSSSSSLCCYLILDDCAMVRSLSSLKKDEWATSLMMPIQVTNKLLLLSSNIHLFIHLSTSPILRAEPSWAELSWAVFQSIWAPQLSLRFALVSFELSILKQLKLGKQSNRSYSGIAIEKLILGSGGRAGGVQINH